MESRPPTFVSQPATRPGLVRLEGGEVLAILHRIGTQSLEDLQPGAVRTTLFCDFRGRLLYRAAAAVTADGAVWLARDDGPAQDLAAYIDRHIFREDARLTDAPAGVVVRPMPGAVKTPAGQIVEQDGVPVWMQLAPDFAYALKALDPERPPSPSRHERLEFERINAGRPRHGHEIHLDFNPFEIGCAHEVHLSKGCFTGQEALQRLITYKSIRRRLTRLIGSGPMPDAPREIRRDGQRVGVLTSVAADGDDWMGLGVLRHEALDAAETLEIEGGTMVDVVEPFAQTHPLGLPEA